MHNYLINCDDEQEGYWFKNLNSRFNSSDLRIIPRSREEINALGFQKILEYDRPDIILQDNGQSILVLEKTTEVPSGHNVGQRYGRLLAAAESRIPVVYFGPYAAYKHGGDTAGPRYMNLRLFYSLNNVSNEYNTAVTTICWPVDNQYEVLKTPDKDNRVREYLSLFFSYYDNYGFSGLTTFIKNSNFQHEQLIEQEKFVNNEIRNPEQYDYPPDTVKIIDANTFNNNYLFKYNIQVPLGVHKIVLYYIGMKYIRSDPYAGMSALYKHLYVKETDWLVLFFENIPSKDWYKQNSSSKTYRMYKKMADAILFKDAFILKENL